MPPWFIDIESATEMEAKSNGTPPASRTPAAASRANWPRSALQGVTRPSVDATPTKGFRRSAAERPRLRRNARCRAHSTPCFARPGPVGTYTVTTGAGCGHGPPGPRGARRIGAPGTYDDRRQAERSPVDESAARVVIDQDLGDQLLRTIGEAG